MILFTLTVFRDTSQLGSNAVLAACRPNSLRLGLRLELRSRVLRSPSLLYLELSMTRVQARTRLTLVV